MSDRLAVTVAAARKAQKIPSNVTATSVLSDQLDLEEGFEDRLRAAEARAAAEAEEERRAAAAEAAAGAGGARANSNPRT